MNQPFFSILILFWQSEPYLQRCLQSLQAQTFQDFEVILLDNGASEPPDPAVLAILQKFLMKIIHSETNLGFAGGNNLAAKSASGEYLVLLNSDAFPEPDWLATLHQAALNHPGHCFFKAFATADPILDGEWNVYHAGIGVAKNHNQPAVKAQPPACNERLRGSLSLPSRCIRAGGGI